MLGDGITSKNDPKLLPQGPRMTALLVGKFGEKSVTYRQATPERSFRCLYDDGDDDDDDDADDDGDDGDDDDGDDCDGGECSLSDK